MPHEHAHVLAEYHQGGAGEVQRAIDAAARGAARVGGTARGRSARQCSSRGRAARRAVARHAQRRDHARPVQDRLPGRDRRRVRADRLLALQRQLHAAAASSEQPISAPGMWNRLEYRPLEGFVFAVTPFNFTSIAGNLPTAPALMGNTVVWKPAATAVYSAYLPHEAARGGGPAAGRDQLGARLRRARSATSLLAHRDLAGIHFTGIDRGVPRDVADGRREHRPLPRAIRASSARPAARISSSRIRRPIRRRSRPRSCAAAFEYQGQKCSAARRVYVPSNCGRECATRSAAR